MGCWCNKRQSSHIGEQKLTSFFGSRHFIVNKKGFQGLGGVYPVRADIEVHKDFLHTFV